MWSRLEVPRSGLQHKNLGGHRSAHDILQEISQVAGSQEGWVFALVTGNLPVVSIPALCPHSDAFAKLLESGDLSMSSVRVDGISMSFQNLLAKICFHHHFSGKGPDGAGGRAQPPRTGGPHALTPARSVAVVERVGSCASLYSRSIQGHHVCLLVKKVSARPPPAPPAPSPCPPRPRSSECSGPGAAWLLRQGPGSSSCARPACPHLSGHSWPEVGAPSHPAPSGRGLVRATRVFLPDMLCGIHQGNHPGLELSFLRASL